MDDAICEQYGPLAVRHTKAQIERAAQAAHAQGLSPNEACPHPFQSKCGMHWLAAFNLAIPLPAKPINTLEPPL
jgi:hypothetical protein